MSPSCGRVIFRVGSTPREEQRAEVAANLVVPPFPPEPVLLPGSKVDGLKFLVPNVVDLNFTNALRLPSHFSLPLHAIYTFFHEETWDVYVGECILDWQHLTVKHQLSVSPGLDCYHYFSFAYVVVFFRGLASQPHRVLSPI